VYIVNRSNEINVNAETMKAITSSGLCVPPYQMLIQLATLKFNTNSTTNLHDDSYLNPNSNFLILFAHFESLSFMYLTMIFNNTIITIRPPTIISLSKEFTKMLVDSNPNEPNFVLIGELVNEVHPNKHNTCHVLC